MLELSCPSSNRCRGDLHELKTSSRMRTLSLAAGVLGRRRSRAPTMLSDETKKMKKEV